MTTSRDFARNFPLPRTRRNILSFSPRLFLPSLRRRMTSGRESFPISRWWMEQKFGSKIALFPRENVVRSTRNKTEHTYRSRTTKFVAVMTIWKRSMIFFKRKSIALLELGEQFTQDIAFLLQHCQVRRSWTVLITGHTYKVCRSHLCD